jgi:serine protease
MSLKVCGVLAAAFLMILAGPRVPTAQTPSAAALQIVPGPPAIDNGLKANTLEEFRSPITLPDDGLPYVTGRVIVKLRDGFPPASLAAVTGAIGATPTEPLPYANFRVLTIGANVDPEQTARTLAARPEVEYAQAVYRAQFHFVPNDPLYRSQWNFPAIDMERAWDINQGASSDIIVAVLDSGVAFENALVTYVTQPFNVLTPTGVQLINHGTVTVPYAAAPDLARPDRIVAPFDFTWNNTHPFDTLGHGTHVAGTIGQLTNNGIGGAGMAFNVRLMPVKVAAGGPWEEILGAPNWRFNDEQVARAIRYAADNGAKAINMSFGRTGGQPAAVVEDAVRYAVSRGAFCVFSAGNGALQGSPIERYAEIAPRVNGAVAVGAVGPSLARARYSSVGSWVELSAPGGDTFLTGISGAIVQQSLDSSFFASPFVPPRFDVVQFIYSQGTSMAAPHVTGFAALLAQQGLTSPAAIEEAMKRYATDRGASGRDDEYGAGLINPRATLRGLGLAK